MSAPALAVAFYDHARELYGSARSGATRALRGPPAHGRARGPPGGARGRRLAGDAAGPARARVRAGLARGRPRRCGGHRVHGARRGRRASAWTAWARWPRRARLPAWDELDALRTISGAGRRAARRRSRWAARPRGARGHDEEDRDRPAARRGAAARGGERAHLDRLRRRRAPAQRRPRALDPGRGVRPARLRASCSPDRRSTSTACRCTRRSSAGGSTAATPPAPTS